MLADCLNVPLSDAIVRSDHMSDDIEAGHKIYTVDTDLIVIDSSLRLCSSAVSYLLTLAWYQVNRNTANVVWFLMLNDLNGHINHVII